MVGGFSADAVNDVLLRISETLRTLVRGSGEAIVKAQEQKFIAESKRAEVTAKLRTASDLGGLLNELKTKGASKEAIDRVQAMIDAALGSAGGA